MTITIKKPEQGALIDQQLKSGLFQDVDEFLTKALHGLREHSGITVGQTLNKRWSTCQARTLLPGQS